MAVLGHKRALSVHLSFFFFFFPAYISKKSAFHLNFTWQFPGTQPQAFSLVVLSTWDQQVPQNHEK